MKYNTIKKTVDGVKFVFVTRGKAKDFTSAEMNEFLKDYLDEDVPVKTDAPPFKIRDELRQMFLKDMRQFGVQHCVNKFGGTTKQITDEAMRIAPYMNREFKE